MNTCIATIVHFVLFLLEFEILMEFPRGLTAHYVAIDDGVGKRAKSLNEN
jgi:hypothetical protein